MQTLFSSAMLMANAPDNSCSTESQDADNVEQNPAATSDGHVAQVGLTLIKLCSISENLVFNDNQFSQKGIILSPAMRIGCLVWGGQ